MNKRLGFFVICLTLIFGTALFSLNLKHASATQASGEKTLILYDAKSGVTPDTKMMSFFDFPPGDIIQTYEKGSTVLDTTTAGNGTYAGWIANETNTLGFPSLNRAAGFQLDFTIQVENESHTNDKRAGFSVIILGEDARGVELAFWENEIWAQNDDATGGLFTPGEGIRFATTTGPINYQIIVINDSYTLTANGASILTGLLRDYSKFEGFPDPYQSPNFIFLGDDTTSAQARIRLSYVSVAGTERAAPATGPSPSNSPTPNPSPTAIKDSAPCPWMPWLHHQP